MGGGILEDLSPYLLGLTLSLGRRCQSCLKLEDTKLVSRALLFVGCGEPPSTLLHTTRIGFRNPKYLPF